MLLVYAFIFATFVVFLQSYIRREINLPPGPRRLPLLGNLHQIPTKNPWKVFQKWHEKYGPIISLRLGQRTVIIIGKYDVAHELLDKRREIYSSRPALIMNEKMTKGLHMAFMPYGERWKTHHSIHTAYLNARMSHKYRNLQDMESKQLLCDIMNSDNIASHFRRFSYSVSFALAHGKRLAATDREILEVEHVTDQIVRIFHESGSALVEIFPMLNYLPRRWAKWKDMGEEFHQRVVRFYSSNMMGALQQKSWNWTKESLRLKSAQPLSAPELAYVTGVLHSGNEVTQAVLGVFVMVCLLYPQAVHRAQEELDQVVGLDRLPAFEDAPNLPYLRAFINEILRWQSPTPMGVPHATSEDDEYLGYQIPKGTTILVNHWAIDHDEDIFENAGEFQPERWLKNPKLPQISFGWGRRVCLGQHMGRNSLYVLISRLLWGFEVDSQDDNRKKFIESWDMVQSLTSGPSSLKAMFRPRDPQKQRVMETAWETSEKDVDTILAEVWSVKK
ncbi:hypothetical protein PDE_01433 [Penicillium oxalicum 114-2]|uniref:Cytochrome P450 n=1 Tax=Penicillium oxalicum (strain 114-2 / CGMCC 5302) TaxID=933388 RepID=S7ZCS6_PENO1|nr:hypothetical protein PDE_01433 [Penicillium oxalicum 114-2]